MYNLIICTLTCIVLYLALVMKQAQARVKPTRSLPFSPPPTKEIPFRIIFSFYSQITPIFYPSAQVCFQITEIFIYFVSFRA